VPLRLLIAATGDRVDVLSPPTIDRFGGAATVRGTPHHLGGQQRVLTVEAITQR
jgi:hypothetical protein